MSFQTCDFFFSWNKKENVLKNVNNQFWLPLTLYGEKTNKKTLSLKISSFMFHSRELYWKLLCGLWLSESKISISEE